jgi:16S rRNA (cytosine1402-N4)-methyltransferase
VPAHTPVLLAEVVEQMRIAPAGSYIDATFGRGGHSRALLARLGPHGRLLVVDRDPQALIEARELAATDGRVTVADGPYSRLAEFAAARGQVDGILFDVGLSSPQVDDAGRGFSFRHDAPLDMRMDPRTGESAAQWLARAGEAELSEVLWQYGEERRDGS